MEILKNVKCIDLTYEGKGVVKSNNSVVFVNGLFPGEEADIEILYKRAGCLYGKVKKLHILSKDRIQPRCKVCTACGGCQLQQLSYKAQLDYKSKKVKEQLKKVGKIDFEVNPTIGMNNPYNYRNKIQVPFRYNTKGQIVYGFYKEGTHEIIEIDECSIEDARAYSILKTIKDLLIKFKLSVYNEDKNTGLLRHVLIRTSYYKEQIMVVLITNGFDFPGRNNFIKELTKLEPSITTVIQNDNHRHTNVILGEKERVLYGKGYIEDSLCGLTYKISSKSFYQTNPVMTEKLYTYAVEKAGIDKDTVVFDAYSGIGTIGLTACSKAKNVIAAELVKEAVLDSIENAKRNNMSNYKSYCADATEFIKELKDSGTKIDVLFMDPPRKGSTKEFLEAAKYLEPRCIVYVSCDPSSLARDLTSLLDKYQLMDVQPFDMFPNTIHIETVVCLVKKA